MKTPEDEAFDDLARKQGAWGGGFQAKRQMAADKQHWSEEAWRKNNWRCNHGWLRGEQCDSCNAAQPPSEWAGIKAILDEYGLQAIDFVADFKAALAQPAQEPYDQTALELCGVCGWKTLIPTEGCLNCERKVPLPVQEALYGMNQDDWKDVVAAIVKVRDGRGIYLGCRPADVFQEWFLALGTAKVKEKNTWRRTHD